MPDRVIPLPKGYRARYFSSIDSTNSEALRLASKGEPSGLWIWSAKQHAGRGRLGRTWESLSGNLFSSLLLRLQCDPAIAPQLGFVAGVAMHDALMSLQPEGGTNKYQLKWPNDLILNEKKAGGMLLESLLLNTNQQVVVIGIGLNVKNHPHSTAYPATSLEEAGIETTADQVLVQLAHQCDTWIKVWDNGSGFSTIRNAWLDRSFDIGTDVTVRLPETLIAGRFNGIDDHGSLILIMNDGTKKLISAGDVFPL